MCCSLQSPLGSFTLETEPQLLSFHAGECIAMLPIAQSLGSFMLATRCEGAVRVMLGGI